MLKIKVINNAVVLSTKLSLEEIRKLEKYAPQALAITSKEEDEELFRIATNHGQSAISEYGILFANETQNKHAVITDIIPEYIAENKEVRETYLKDKYFTITKYVNTIEKQAAEALKQLDTEMTAFNNIVEYIEIDE